MLYCQKLFFLFAFSIHNLTNSLLSVRSSKNKLSNLKKKGVKSVGGKKEAHSRFGPLYKL